MPQEAGLELRWIDLKLHEYRTLNPGRWRSIDRRLLQVVQELRQLLQQHRHHRTPLPRRAAFEAGVLL